MVNGGAAREACVWEHRLTILITTTQQTYAVNNSSPVSLPLTPTDDASHAVAAIPAASLPPATLLRWRVACAGGSKVASPPDGGWYGVLVGAPLELFGLPTLDWFAPSLPASTSDAGATNTDVVAFNGQGYGRGYAIARVARKGTTSRAWPKPKTKFRVAPGQGGVSIAPRAANATYTPSSSFELNSLYWEPGENS